MFVRLPASLSAAARKWWRLFKDQPVAMDTLYDNGVFDSLPETASNHPFNSFKQYVSHGHLPKPHRNQKTAKDLMEAFGNGAKIHKQDGTWYITKYPGRVLRMSLKLK